MAAPTVFLPSAPAHVATAPRAPAPAPAAPPPADIPAQLPLKSVERTLQAVPTIAELIPVADLQPRYQQPRTPEPARQPEAQAPALEPEDLYAVFAPPKEADEDIAADTDMAEASAPAPAAKSGRRTPPGRSRTKLIAAVVVAVAVGGGGLFAAKMYGGASAAAPSLGTLVVQSNPAGVEVFVDGESRGMTPSRISLAAGPHILELRGRGVPREIPFDLKAGGQVSQYLEFADTPLTGLLVVYSQPAGAKVSVDGVARGVAPLTLEGLQPGDHEVLLQNETGSSRHVVKVLAGTTASLVAPVTAAAPPNEGPVSGWISVKAPVTIEIREDGQLIGTTETDRVMMAAGRHVVEFVNQGLGYRETRTVQVVPGKVVGIAIDLPKGTLNLNASPWAEVWIDGRRVGETPIGNLEVSIGPHEILFRHPEFGEKRHAISVTAGAPVRLSVSMK
jgi:hypothetical protein